MMIMYLWGMVSRSIKKSSWLLLFSSFSLIYNMRGQKYHIESKQKKYSLFSKNERKQDELLRRTHRRYMDEVAGRAIAKYKIWSWSLNFPFHFCSVAPLPFKAQDSEIVCSSWSWWHQNLSLVCSKVKARFYFLLLILSMHTDVIIIYL